MKNVSRKEDWKIPFSNLSQLSFSEKAIIVALLFCLGKSDEYGPGQRAVIKRL